MLGFLPDAPDAAGSRLTPHRDEGEGLAADAQVLPVRRPAPAGAHVPHPVQVLGAQEGLGGPAAARLAPDELLPFVLVERKGRPGGDVALDEGVVAVVPFGALAGSLVFSEGMAAQQEANGEREESPVGGHHTAGLRGKKHKWDCLPNVWQTV